MLLRHTTSEVTERQALTVNPAKTCQPIGAMYAALGIHNCLPHSHGSQGCCSYHRSTLTRHYKEPVMAATSSFTEGSSVFGGQANLLQAISTIFSVYDPDVIAVHTTCLSETIGDDIPQILAKARDEGKIPAGKRVIHANTPSYVGSHVTGFANMVKGMVTYFAEPAGQAEQDDQRHPRLGRTQRHARDQAAAGRDGHRGNPLSRHVRRARCPADRQTRLLSQGRRDESSSSSGRRPAQATVALGPSGSEAGREGTRRQVQGALRTAWNCPSACGRPTASSTPSASWPTCRSPTAIREERGRMMDIITDMHQYFYRKRVALWGDPDQLVSLVEFLADLDMRPVYIVTGTPGKAFEKRIETALAGRVPEAKVRYGANADMFLMHQWIKQEPVDLLIGNTYGKYIARDENIPLVRHGFPILDRIGHSYFPTVGYAGGMRLLEQILGALMDRQDREAKEESFELTM